MKIATHFLSLATASLALMTATAANAVQYGFSYVAGDSSSPSIASGLTMDVNVVGTKVEFTFQNNAVTSGNVAVPSSITGIWFETSFGSLLSAASIGTETVGGTGGGVDFSVGSGDITGTKPAGWAGAAFELDANNPAGFQKNGIDLGEFLNADFNGAANISTILADLNSGSDRVVLKMQSIGGSSGSSADFVNGVGRSTQSIPDGGASMLLLGIAMTGLTVVRRLVRN